MKGSALVETLKKAGLCRATGVPCSYFGDFYATAAADKNFTYVPAANEGAACGIAAGWSLSESPGVVLIQNSGLGNAVNPLTSLQSPYRIPLLLLVSGRAWNNEDEQQHEAMGQQLESWLALCGFKVSICPDSAENLQTLLIELKEEMTRQGSLHALIVPKGLFESAPRNSSTAGRPTLATVCQELKPFLGSRPLVTTTGFSSRAACEFIDREQNFYMQGSMGHATAIALGLAEKDRSVVVLDGDAGAAMHLGTLATVGRQKPKGYVHLVLNNAVCGSTGGQDSGVDIDFPALALSCGYAEAWRAGEDLAADLKRVFENEGPVLLEIKTAVEAEASPRISKTISHEDIAGRLQQSLRGK